MKLVKKHFINIFMTKIFCLAVMFYCANISNAYAQYTVSDIRVGQGVGNIRIVFDSSKQFQYSTILLDNPKRLVIDVLDSKVNPKISSEKINSDIVSSIRVGDFEDGKTRVVLSLKQPISIKKVFFLNPQGNFNWRFVIDIIPTSIENFVSSSEDSSFVSTISDLIDTMDISSKLEKPTRRPAPKKVANSRNQKVIVLDAGHGGKDPGAIGFSGIHEKTITLSMAKELKEILDKDSRYKVYLTRSNDTFISLRGRVGIARKHDADLFISIHADSAKNRNAIGLSVYTLSENASDKEAASLADRENKVDIIMGLDLGEHSREVSDILINLAQRETMNRSSEFAGIMVEEMNKSAKLVSDTHRFAGFAVLKAPDVPSVLLELGYLSNRREEGLLKQKSYRNKLAISTKRAIDRYFDLIN